MSEFVTNHFIYTDSCNEELRSKISETLQLGVVVRNEVEWDLSYMVHMLTNPLLNVVVINQINERSIAEIGIAAFMCKQVLVTSRAIEEYPSVKLLANDCEIGCNLDSKNSTFINWYNYTIGR